MIIFFCTANAQQTIRIAGSETMREMLEDMSKEYKKIKPDINIIVSGGHTEKGLEKILEGQIDLCAISKAPSGSFIAQLKAKHNTIGVKIAVAMECIAVFVHNQNPISQLSSEQIADIYSGEVKNWKELGGKDEPILIARLPDESGTCQLFKNRIMAGAEYDEKAIIKNNSAQIADWINKTPNGIAFGKLVDKKSNTKALSIKDYNQTSYVEPTLNNLKNNSYPLSRQLFLFSIQEPKGEIKDFIEWLTNKETQKLVTKYGFYPVIEGIF
ncbi:MAG: PstS family phosphate ABC transporter substrate-binding protein [Bacteroidia bacterium]|nr:PstS family phosphate ABC transporter substrate-binding protein [Bacteroidia bacterium]MDW8346990.1 PstS family phosphate ABC transporter substrate-binding protein [Bacteroidia bacterium]